jgi:hypothetical protein
VNALTLDWAGVVRKLGRLPSRAEYCEHGIHHAGTLHARIVWSQMAHKFVLLVREFHLEREWADVVKIVVGKFPLLETSIQPSSLEGSIQQSALSIQSRNAVDNADRQGGGMKLGKVVAAALAIEIFMAAERSSQQRSTQQSAVSIQPSNWQLANGNWQEQNQDQNLEPQRTPVRLAALAQGRLRTTEESTVVADGGGETQVGEVGRELTQIDANQNLEPQRAQRNTEEMHALEDAHGLCAAGRAPCGRPVVYGEPLGLAAMAHAPTNELGVLFLFGIVAADLGFRVERLQAAFPDCEAKREVAPGKWELVLLELEIYSRNFKSHRHDPRGCHGIVCWKHNWPDCPEWLEVIELSKVVKRLGDRE